MNRDYEAHWMGLCIRSESDQPHEWRGIGWVIRNRVLRRGYPGDVYGVVTQRLQFSYFNRFEESEKERPERLWQLAASGYAGDRQGWGENDLDEAIACAEDVLSSPRWRAPFGPEVIYFWSPVSMQPRGSDPKWAKGLRRIILPGIEPARFTFAAA